MGYCDIVGHEQKIGHNGLLLFTGSMSKSPSKDGALLELDEADHNVASSKKERSCRRSNPPS